MSATRRGLGRGLGALIPTGEEQQDSEQIAVEEIKSNNFQPRKNFDPTALEELAQSIKEHGVLQPVVVRPVPGGYQLVVGERRMRAAKMVGMETIPAVVMELTDRQMAEIALIENLQREDLNPMEEAVAYSRLLEDFDLTQDALALRLGKSRPAIANTLRLLSLDPQVQQMIEDGKLSAGHGRTLLSLPQEEQAAAAREMLNTGLTVRKAEQKHGKKRKAAPAPLSPNLAEVQQQLMEALGTKVAIEDKGQRGKIVIDYYSPDDANRIVKRILDR